MPKTFIGGAECREFESQAPAADEMLDRLECLRNWRQSVRDSWRRDVECF